MYRLGPAAERDLARLPGGVVARIVAALERLPAGDIKRLQGVPYERLRVGDYRVILSLSGGGGMVLVHRICNRRDLERVIGQLR